VIVSDVINKEKIMMYNNELDMYPDICQWLHSHITEKFSRTSKKITVLDTHDSDLSNFIIKLKYQTFFPEFSTYKIRQDITAFIEYEKKVDLVFVECKNTQLTLNHLSQLIGYSCIALPIFSILISPYGMGEVLSKLFKNFNRQDILEFRPTKFISIIKWDFNKKDIDYMNSIIIDI